MVRLFGVRDRPLLLVGPEEVSASVPAGRRTATASFGPSLPAQCVDINPDSSDTLAGLAEATAAVREELQLPTGTIVDIALMRPLVSVRTAALPPTAPLRLVRLLELNAARFFPWTDATIASVLSVSPRRRPQPSAPTLIAGVRLVDCETISRGIIDGGLRIGRMTAAPLLLAAALAGKPTRSETMSGGESPEPVLFLTPFGSAVEATMVQRGQVLKTVAWPIAVGTGGTEADRQGRCAIDLLQLIGDAGWAFSQVLLPDGTFASALAAALPDASLAFGEVTTACMSTATDEPIVRLLHAGLAAAVAPTAELFTPDAAATMKSRNRRLAYAIGVAAAVLLVGMPGVHLWGLGRELSYVRDARSAIAESAAVAFETQTTIRRISTITDRLAQVERDRTSWTSMLMSLAFELPKSAYLLAVDGGEDGLRLSGVTSDSVETREALLRRGRSGVSWHAAFDEALGTVRFEAESEVPIAGMAESGTFPAGESQR